MRCRIPIIYLVDSAGVNLPYQGGVFPGQYGASRIFYYNSIMRRYLRIPQLAAVMGPCIAGGAYLPALVRRDRHGQGHVVHGARRPQPREGRHRPDDRRRDARRRRARTPRSAAWRTTPWTTTPPCLAKLRDLVGHAAAPPRCRCGGRAPTRAGRATRESLYDLLPADHRMSYDMHEVLRAHRSTTARSTSSSADLAARDDLRRRAHRGHPGRRHRQPARADQGPRRRDAALRRHRLRRERREGRVLHRSLRPRSAFRCCSCRTSRGSWSGPRPSTRGSFAPARGSSRRWPRPACRRSCSPSTTRPAPATTPWRGRGSTPTSSSAGPPAAWRVMEGESAVQAVHGPALEAARKAGEAAVAPSVDARRWTRCAPTTSTSSTRATPARAASSTRSSTPRTPAHVLALALPRRAPESGSAPRARSFFPHTSTTHDDADRRRSCASRRARGSGATGSRRRAGRSRAAPSTT